MIAVEQVGGEAGKGRLRENILPHVVTFAVHHIASDDIDPVYPVLRNIHRLMALEEEERLWLTSLYLAYYNLPSALAAFRLHPTPASAHLFSDDANRLPCGTERRGLRGGKVKYHIASYLETIKPFESQKAFLTSGWDSDEVQNYERFWNSAQTIWCNGRWAAFKWSELLKDVHGLPLSAPDMRMEFCSGPKEGLCWLYQHETASVPELNRYGADLRQRMEHAGIPLDWENLETVLCDFNSLRKGHYYVGHDIDQMQEQIEKALVNTILTEEEARLIYMARSLSFQPHYLGELNGWYGVNPRLRTLYRDEQILFWRHA